MPPINFSKPLPVAKVVGTNHQIFCTVCDKYLGTLVESKEKSKKITIPSKYQCLCICGGDSFVINSLNECFFVPDSKLTMKDIKTVLKYRDGEQNAYRIDYNIIMGE